MKKIFLCSIISIIGLVANAQITTISDSSLDAIENQKQSRLDFNVGLETSHLWRGLVINDGMTVTGYVHYALDKNQNLITGVWGGAGFDGKYTEINYFVEYHKNNFSIGLWDLFNSSGVSSPDVFDYNKNTTMHIIDLRTSYRFSDSFPLRVEADFLLYGNDRELSASLDARNRYSTYVELGYPVIKNQKVNLDLFVGAGFALDSDSHLYTNQSQSNFDIVNAGFKVSKNISIFDYKLPVAATTMWNPADKIARVQLSVDLF